MRASRRRFLTGCAACLTAARAGLASADRVPAIHAAPSSSPSHTSSPTQSRRQQPSPGQALERHEASRLSMACVYGIIAYGPPTDPARPAAAASPGWLPRLLEAALDEVDRIDRLMSHYKPESPLSRLNRNAAAGPVVVDPELFDLIAESLHYSRESDGAFDITVGPLMKAWGFFRGDGRLPAPGELDAVRQRIGYRHVRLDPARRTIQFDRDGIDLDLGGIAKGYAVDRVAALLRAGGVTSALISAGGSTLYALGAPPEKAAWEVTLQDPLDERRTVMTLPLKDRALSIAGRSEKSFEADGVIYSHIMDPRTARPVQGMLTVAVLAPTGTSGDALDDVLFVEGVEKSRATLARLPEVEAFFFLPAAPPARADGAARGYTMVHLPR